jgi:Flp pilus assembly protein TadG
MNVRGDRGSVSVVLAMLVVVCLAGAGLIVDGGRAMVARRHASNTAEAAARAAVATSSPIAGLDRTRATSAAVSYAGRAGVAPSDVRVEVIGRTVTVTVTERRSTVFLVLGGRQTLTVRASGSARVEYSD